MNDKRLRRPSSCPPNLGASFGTGQERVTSSVDLHNANSRRKSLHSSKKTIGSKRYPPKQQAKPPIFCSQDEILEDVEDSPESNDDELRCNVESPDISPNRKFALHFLRDGDSEDVTDCKWDGKVLSFSGRPLSSPTKRISSGTMQRQVMASANFKIAPSRQKGFKSPRCLERVAEESLTVADLRIRPADEFSQDRIPKNWNKAQEADTDTSDTEASDTDAADSTSCEIYENPKTKKKPLKVQKHVMLSYQWDSQEIMLRLYRYLIKKGLPVWMDKHDIAGDIIEGMAKGVEGAAIIVMGITKKFKESENCRDEVKYARENRVKMLPLKLESEYPKGGWLGFISHSLQRVDLTTGKEIDNFEEILSKIRKLVPDWK